MLKNHREKVLAGSLAVIVGLSAGQDAVNAVVFGPLEEKDAQVAALMQAVGDRELEFDRIEHAQRELQSIRDRSLPPDPAVATTLYQNWLIETAKKSGIDAAQIIPSRAISEESVGHKILVTLQATTGTRQLGTFLDAFYQVPLLHRVTSLSLNSPNGPRTTQPRVTLAVEALSLSDAAPRTELFAVPVDARSTVVSSETSAQKFFAARDPFRRGYNDPPAPAPRTTVREKPKAPPVDPLTKIRLVASFLTGTQTEVWFYDSQKKRQTTVAQGESFRLATMQGKLLEVRSNSVTVEIDGQRKRLAIGDHLKQFTSPE